MATKINGENYRTDAYGKIYKEAKGEFLYFGDLNGRSLKRAVNEINAMADWSDAEQDDRHYAGC